MELGPDLKLLVFDFDGTLLHLPVDWAQVRRRLGIEGTEETVGVALARLAGTGDPRLAAVTECELAALGDQRISPAVTGALAALADRYHLAVLTRNSRMVVERAFAGTDLGPKLDIVGREDVRRLKPDPDGLYQILARAAVRPDQAALIGDTYHDVEAARAAGVFSVVVRNDHLAYPPEGADRYLARIEDLVPWLT